MNDQAIQFIRAMIKLVDQVASHEKTAETAVTEFTDCGEVVCLRTVTGLVESRSVMIEYSFTLDYKEIMIGDLHRALSAMFKQSGPLESVLDIFE